MAVQVDAGADRVIAGYMIPPGGKLNAVHIKLHTITDAAMGIDKMVQYGVTGYVVSIQDPRTAQSFDDVWDEKIPKDVAVAIGAASNELDMDPTTAVAAPEFTPGLLSMERIVNLGLAPMRIFKREVELTFANTPKGDTTATWFPTDTWSAQINKQVRTRVPSLVLLAFGVPNMVGLTTTAVPTTFSTTQEWYQYSYLEDTLVDAMKEIVGLTEAGAVAPYADAITLIKFLLEPTPVEDSAVANAYADGADANYLWNVFCKATFDVSVPGHYRLPVLSSGR